MQRFLHLFESGKWWKSAGWMLFSLRCVATNKSPNIVFVHACLHLVFLWPRHAQTWQLWTWNMLHTVSYPKKCWQLRFQCHRTLPWGTDTSLAGGTSRASQCLPKVNGETIRLAMLPLWGETIRATGAFAVQFWYRSKKAHLISLFQCLRMVAMSNLRILTRHQGSYIWGWLVRVSGWCHSAFNCCPCSFREALPIAHTHTGILFGK